MGNGLFAGTLFFLLKQELSKQTPEQIEKLYTAGPYCLGPKLILLPLFFQFHIWHDFILSRLPVPAPNWAHHLD